MRGGRFIAVLLCAVHALAVVGRAEGPASPNGPPPVPAPAVSLVSPGPDYQSPPTSAVPASQSNPLIQLIRVKLTDSDLRKGANNNDLAALESFYAARIGEPLWVTEMGLSSKAQTVVFEIEKAADWGLDPAAFDLPSTIALPGAPEAGALAEIKLDLAILKYARFARGGRVNPATVSRLFDQVPPIRDPNTVLAEIAGADEPAQYLQSLHPKHEQFMRLRQALLKARGDVGEGAGTTRSSAPDPQHGALAVDARDLGSRLRVEQFTRVYAVCDQGRKTDLRR